MNSLLKILAVTLIFYQITFGASLAESAPPPEAAKKKGPPPMLVAVESVTAGKVEPMIELVGTIYYARIAQVAAEVNGLVILADFEEGQQISKGENLVTLSSDILEKTIRSTRASMQRAKLELEKAEKDLNRTKPLFADQSLSEATFDEYYFRQKTLIQKVISLQSSLDLLLLEKKKKIITMPFDGVVLSKNAEIGEWINKGGPVAQVADNNKIDAIIELPEEMIRLLDKGREVTVLCGGKKHKALFNNFVPKGDTKSRTFPAKFRIQDPANLAEGMAAKVLVPASNGVESLIVSRDAVINKFGNDVIFLNQDGIAKMVQVKVTGYSGLQAGIAGKDLKKGQLVIINGNERLRDGMPVRVDN